MNVMKMNKHIKLIVTVIAITSILCCFPVASAVDATEPTEARPDQSTESVTVLSIEHEAICSLMLAIGIPSGCMIAQGFSFWKW